MKPQLILHIGHPKTGTTSIQNTLSAARPWLLERGVLYPQTKLTKLNHRVLGPAIYDYTDDSVLNARLGGTKEKALQTSIRECESVLEQVAKARPKTVILSSEGLFGSLLNARPEKMREFVQRISNDPPRILGYVRSPTLYYLSIQQQRLKGARLLKQPSKYRRLDAVAALQDCLGTEVELRAFQRDRLINYDVVSDFAEWIGHPELVPQFSVEEENTSISAEAMSVLHRLAPDAAISDMASLKAQRRLTKVVKRLDERIPEPTKPVLHENVAAYITKLNTDLIGLRDQYDIHFKDIDYSLVGQDPGDDVPIIQSVEDACTVNKQRRDLLEARALKALAGGRSRWQVWKDRLRKLRA
ncbi:MULTISPECIES: hypothetical protein [unclassified Yoonia]|uniref:hypothetical protein n=1 Tax=unclassified Yoonia TaxID=2629118 RepID=UPI002AFFC9F2|nr:MULTISPECIES: hypothetical protein [unclassified Yoonia]